MPGAGTEKKRNRVKTGGRRAGGGRRGDVERQGFPFFILFLFSFEGERGKWIDVDGE